jgi:hypothetical protein
MAKDDKKRKKDGARATEITRVPAENEGRAAHLVVEILRSPIAQEVIASLLTAAVTAILARGERRGEAGRPQNASPRKSHRELMTTGVFLAGMIAQGIAAFSRASKSEKPGAGRASRVSGDVPPRKGKNLAG